MTFTLSAQTDMGQDWGASIGLWAILAGSLANGGTVDFSHTAYIHVDAAPGATFSADSGTVYTSAVVPPSTIPEASDASLLLSGLALLGAAGWKNRRRKA